jgi:hypothetical protein
MKKTSYHAIAALALASVALVACGDLSPSDLQKAELAAMKFSVGMDATYLGCSGKDSDQDGYVTCSAQSKATLDIKELSCSYTGAGGCKLK